MSQSPKNKRASEIRGGSRKHRYTKLVARAEEKKHYLEEAYNRWVNRMKSWGTAVRGIAGLR